MSESVTTQAKAPSLLASMSTQALVYVAAVCLVGLASLVDGLQRTGVVWTFEFTILLISGLVASTVRVTIPGITGSYSANFIVLIYGLGRLDKGQLLLIAALSMLVQTLRTRFSIHPLQLLFNVLGICVVTELARVSYSSDLAEKYLASNSLLRLGLAAGVYYLANTMLTAAAIGFTERKPLFEIWRRGYAWSFSYYFLGASVARMVEQFGLEAILVVTPLAYVLFVSFRLQIEQREQEKQKAESMQRHAEDLQRYAEEVAAIHLRTIEALALAIEAKDDTTHDHLQRVQVYALEVGRELGLSDDELKALEAASFLHDIGKIAVPDYIISKPGKLTPEEFEKMKVHPVVGAEILESVGFPYPVVPIVRAHHEKWDGRGYPYGLKGEEIPIGARILSAVDCLDALASHRQYRPALPIDKAMEIVLSESGKAYDPRVVEVIHRRFHELEMMAKAAVSALEPGPKLSKEIKIVAGEAPAAGFQQSARDSQAKRYHWTPEMTEEMFAGLSTTLELPKLYEILETHIRKMLPCDCLAIYLRHGERLIPAYVQGEDSELFASLEIPMGQGLSGWVAENRKALLNGNPAVEPGYLNDPSRFTMLRSGLAVPLVADDIAMGVIALYSSDRDAYHSDHLRLMQTIGPRFSTFLHNALHFNSMKARNLVDEITGLPNSAALFPRLDEEIARSRRTGAPLAVLAADLNQFARVNTRFGRAEGDRLLRSLGSLLRAGCREYDTVARTGDDQFTIILPGCAPEAVQIRIDKITASVDALALAELGVDSPLLSLTIGAASMPADGSDAETLMALAEKRLHLVRSTPASRDLFNLARAARDGATRGSAAELPAPAQAAEVESPAGIEPEPTHPTI